MDYRLNVAGAPESVPGGTGILLLHPSTAETDQVDTQFLAEDTDRFLVVSTRTTAHEVEQKLEFYDVDKDKATILDAISIERGYSRRQNERVSYLTAPDDTIGLTEAVKSFLQTNDGKLRVSVDSLTELSFYAGTAKALDTVDEMLDLLADHEAVGLFHLAQGVHDPSVVDQFRERFPIIVELADDGTLQVDHRD